MSSVYPLHMAVALTCIFKMSKQISMLQDELAQLTLTELDKRVERQDAEVVRAVGPATLLISGHDTFQVNVS